MGVLQLPKRKSEEETYRANIESQILKFENNSLKKKLNWKFWKRNWICLEIGDDRPDFIGLYLKMVGIWDRDNDEKIRKMILICENGEEKIKHIQKD